jgi:fructose-1,6-bisphosphatase
VVYQRGTTSVIEDMHAIFLRDGVYCGPHYKVAIGKLRFTYVHKYILACQNEFDPP